MNEPIDTPIDRAVQAYEDWYDDKTEAVRAVHPQERAMRAVLTAALKVRWCDDIGYIGPFEVGRIIPLPTLHKWEAWRSDDIEIDRFQSQAEAKTAVERAVIEAIMGPDVSP